MKKLQVLIPAALAISILAAGGITAFAATDTDDSAALPMFGQGREHRMILDNPEDFMPDMEGIEPGMRQELTDEQKAEMKAKAEERLAQMLDEGRITQEEYEQALADLAEGKMMMHFGRGLGAPDGEMPELTDEQRAEMKAKAEERLAQMLDEGRITQEEYEQALADLAEGKMMMHFGRGLGAPDGEMPELTDEQRAEMKAKAEERLAQMLDEGRITQEEYEQALADLAEGKMMMHFGRGLGAPGGEMGEMPEPLTEPQMKMEIETEI